MTTRFLASYTDVCWPPGPVPPLEALVRQVYGLSQFALIGVNIALGATSWYYQEAFYAVLTWSLFVLGLGTALLARLIAQPGPCVERSPAEMPSAFIVSTVFLWKVLVTVRAFWLPRSRLKFATLATLHFLVLLVLISRLDASLTTYTQFAVSVPIGLVACDLLLLTGLAKRIADGPLARRLGWRSAVLREHALGIPREGQDGSDGEGGGTELT